MGGHLTARAWLRERRRLITLMNGDAAGGEAPRRPGQPEGREPDSPWRPRLGRATSAPPRPRKVRRLMRRPRLTVLALNRRDGEARPPWAVDPEITHTAIWLHRLPAAFDGLRIVHLTDIHHSLFTPLEEVERAVYLANRLDPDLVALTGDYVTLSDAYIRPVARALGKLRARRGVFAVLGNHDFQVDASAVTAALRAHHIRVLRNTRRPVRSGGETLWLLGVDDLWWNSDDLPAALKRVPARDAKILLCHNPLGIWQASDRGIDLVLSGHTHGGQVRLPGFSKLYRSKLGERFVEGWNVLKSTQIYVSRGIGKVVLPIRVACPPEIACLQLRRARPGLRHA